MKVIPGTRQADLFGFQSIYKTCFQSIYKIGMPDEGYSRNASSGLVWLSKACLMKVIPGTRQADLFGFQSIYKIGMPDEGYSRNASSGLVWLSKYL